MKIENISSAAEVYGDLEDIENGLKACCSTFTKVDCVHITTDSSGYFLKLSDELQKAIIKYAIKDLERQKDKLVEKIKTL